MQCINCQTETTNPKFCSKSCAAKYNNKHGEPRSLKSRKKTSESIKKWICNHPERRKEMAKVAKVFWKNRKPCSLETRKKISDSLKKRSQNSEKNLCNFKILRQTKLEQKNNQSFELRSLGRKKQFILEEQNYKCFVCGLSEWMGKPIKLQFHHIDGNKKNNERSNLHFLCLNCHGQTDNFGFKDRNHSIETKYKIKQHRLQHRLNEEARKRLAEVKN